MSIGLAILRRAAKTPGDRAFLDQLEMKLRNETRQPANYTMRVLMVSWEDYTRIHNILVGSTDTIRPEQNAKMARDGNENIIVDDVAVSPQ